MADIVDLKNALVVAAAGISTIGIPIIIHLLGRLHDTQIRMLERTTFKSVRDEINALKELQALQAEQLRGRIQAVQQDAAGVEPEELLARQGVAMAAKDELTTIKLFVGSRKGKKLKKRLDPYFSQLQGAVDEIRKSADRHEKLFHASEDANV